MAPESDLAEDAEYPEDPDDFGGDGDDELTREFGQHAEETAVV
jgi:hypothetical protein